MIFNNIMYICKSIINGYNMNMYMYDYKNI